MSFFKNLSELLPEKVVINMSVRNQNGELTVLVVPAHGDTNFAPMSIKGTPELLDKEFHNTVGEALKQDKELLVKLEAHAAEIKKKTDEMAEKKKNNEKAKSLKKSSSKSKDEDKGESLFDNDNDDDEKEENEESGDEE